VKPATPDIDSGGEAENLAGMKKRASPGTRETFGEMRLAENSPIREEN
jgi:hypothetical protein